MNTPICDFVENYARSGTVRMHMPGHKGRSADVCASSEPFSAEALDITEIHGADELFHADGIIAESETNASEVFGCDTYYSTEGSSLGIRAMLYLCRVNAVRTHDGPKSSGTLASSVSRPWVLAARNVHQTFVSACALLDLDVTWLYPKDSLLSMDLSENEVRLALEEARDKGQGMPCCVYLTSPDYLGHILPIRKIADVCHAYSVPLVVDNAHGAYLKFLPTDFSDGADLAHPIDLGADLCCDSAHKTLPVLTGGAYLHVSPEASEKYDLNKEKVKQALVLFASTSPSWLILQSLDRVNPILADGYRARLAHTSHAVSGLRTRLQERGFSLFGEEPLKLSICPGSYGYTGRELATILRTGKLSGSPIEVEFADEEALVLMISESHTEEELDELERALGALPKREAIVRDRVDLAHRPQQVMRIREACMLPFETVALEEAEGRIAHMFSSACPPAVPVVICGEKIEAEEISCLRFYGYNFCQVVADQP